MPNDEELTQPARHSNFDAAKARKAAKEPRRTGERCGAAAASYVPVVDRSRCEGKSECVAVCPYGVFEVRRMEDAEYEALSFLARLKSRVHGRLTAYTPAADQCRACGLCVAACPEHAVTLVRLVADRHAAG